MTIKNNSIGGGVTFIKGYTNKKHNPSSSYHLHFLYSYNADTDRLYVCCLDKSTDFCIYDYSTLSDNEKYKSIYGAMFELSTAFIEQYYNHVVNNHFSREYLFSRMPKEYWDVFNDIKENAFIESMKNVTFHITTPKPLSVPPYNHVLNQSFDINIEDNYIKEISKRA